MSNEAKGWVLTIIFLIFWPTVNLIVVYAFSETVYETYWRRK